MTNSLAILGIHTGIGKTIAAAVMAEALGAYYWKPVQAGVDERDATLVKQLLTCGDNRVFDEAVLLTQPMSPHAAAVIDGVDIDFGKFEWPAVTDTLVIETAGGILSPMSARFTVADFVMQYRLPALLVTQHYLGSINHTLMSIEVLRGRGVDLLGIVINGAAHAPSEQFIQDYTGISVVARIPHFERIDHAVVASCALQIKNSLSESLLPYVHH